MNIPSNRNILVAVSALALAGLVVFVAWERDDSDPQEQPRYSKRQIERSAKKVESTVSRDNIPDEPSPDKVEGPTNADAAIIARAENREQLPGGKLKGSEKTLRDILDDPDLTARERALAIKALAKSGPLSGDDIKAALEYIKNGDLPDGTSRGQKHWLADELMTLLRTDAADNGELSRVLSSIHADKGMDPIIRDYALQHLGHLRAEGGDTTAIGAALSASTHEKEGTIAGTALLALRDRHGSAPVNSEQAASALSIAKDSSYDIRSRITAMQVAGKEGDTEALPFAAETAADITQPASLRMAAIATLADLGANEQRGLLRKLSASTDVRLRTAARAAIKKLNTEANK